MNRKQYEIMRKKLMDEAQTFLDEGKAKEAQEKMDEAQALDGNWDAIAQAEANFRAMNNEPKGYQGYLPDGKFNAGKEIKDATAAWETEEYRSAWAKTLMDRKLDDEEAETFRMVNEAYTHTTKNTGVVIPKTVAARIWELAGELYPYFADIAKTYVNGIFAMVMEDTSSDAGWYEEDAATEDGKETFKEFQLTGCELSRSITVSWKLKEMAIEDFIPYIERKMAKKMGAAAGYGATHGAGPTANSGKPEPTGVVTALEAEDGTPQVITYQKGALPTYKDITAARAKVKSGYGSGLGIYANTHTIWNVLANILDANKRPIFMTDPMNGGFRVLGVPVKEDDSMNDGEILFSNAQYGYQANVNKEVSMMTEEHVKERKTDYCAYAIMDGNVVTTKAHALIKEAAEA